MGWQDRGWFLGAHGRALFDTNGNAGPTVWWDGRIVGGWAQRKTGEVVLRFLEDAGADGGRRRRGAGRPAAGVAGSGPGHPALPYAAGEGARGVSLYVLVGGWPGSGKSTLAVALAAELGLPLLAKDEIKEALADALGAPADVAGSQRLGRAAVLAMLRVARALPRRGAGQHLVRLHRPLVAALPGRVVEVRTVLSRELARRRYRARAEHRHAGHLDRERTEDELWGRPVDPLGAGPLVEVDTSGPLDVPALAARLGCGL